MPCAFSGLSAQVLGPVDAILFVLAIAFVMAIVLRAALPLAPRQLYHPRYPLRGPPAVL